MALGHFCQLHIYTLSVGVRVTTRPKAHSLTKAVRRCSQDSCFGKSMMMGKKIVLPLKERGLTDELPATAIS